MAPVPGTGADGAPEGEPVGADGAVLDATRLADRAAIEALAAAYAYAVDDHDWDRWVQLFVPDAVVDYTSAGGMAGTPAQVAAWLPDAMALFTFHLHTAATHEIVFTSPDRAEGRLQVFNRGGVDWEGRHEIVDVSAIYHDTYVKVADAWRFASRVEQTVAVVGGDFAATVRAVAATTAGRFPPPVG